MTIKDLVNKLEEAIQKQYIRFEKAYEKSVSSENLDVIFDNQREMAKIIEQINYLEDWMSTYNKAKQI